MVCLQLIPADAQALRALCNQTAELSQEEGWARVHTSVIGARLLGVLAVPCAAVSAVFYATRGLLQGGVHVLNGHYDLAGQVLAQDSLSALKCLALTVAAIAYAILGLILGSILFTSFVTKELEEPLLQEPQAIESNRVATALKRQLDAKNEECDVMTNTIIDAYQELHQLKAVSASGLFEQIGATDMQEQVNESSSYRDMLKLPTSVLLNLGQRCYKACSSVLIDQNDPWKAQRYVHCSAKLEGAIGKEDMNALSALDVKPEHNEYAQEIIKKLKIALDSLTIRGLKDEASKQFDDFQGNLRDAKILLSNTTHGLGEDIEKLVNRVCYCLFTTMDFSSFYTKLVYYVSVHGDASLVRKLGLDGQPAEPMLLSEKMKLLFSAQPKRGNEVTSPQTHVAMKKLMIFSFNFDPMLNDNIATTYLTKVFTSKNTGYPPLKAVHFRTGVPIKTKVDVSEKAPKEWQLHGVSFVPEYEAFLDHVVETGQQLLIVLHLDPGLYEAVEKGAYMPKAQEALWIRMFEKLCRSEKYRKNVSLALVPYDGSWLTVDLVKGATADGKNIKNINVFIEWLVELATKEKSPYILPDTIKDKVNFVRNVAEAVRDRYFIPIRDSKNPELETEKKSEKKRLAFLSFFNATLFKALQIHCRATIVQHNCKDGVDRTGAAIGAELCDVATELDIMDSSAFERNLEGLVFGPPLANTKRRIIETHRFDMNMAAIEHLEYLKELGKPLGPVPVFDGYDLTGISWPEDPKMSLYAEPAAAQSLDYYKELLKFEFEHPYTLPSTLSQKDLPQDERNQKERRTVKRKFFIDGVEYKLSKPVGHVKLLVEAIKKAGANPDHMTDVLEDMHAGISNGFFGFLKERYDNLRHNIHVCDVAEMVYRIDKNRLIIERPYKIVVGGNTELAGIIAQAVIPMDRKKETPYYHFKIEKIAEEGLNK